MLVQLGRADEATACARKRFRSADEVLRLSRLLEDAGESDAAVSLAEWGLTLTRTDNYPLGIGDLARWLREVAGAHGRRKVMLKAAAAAFEHSLALDDFRNPTNAVLMRLADAAHASHPDWVIELCERMAEGIMESGQAGFYELAAQWLEKAALAYDAAGRYEDWLAKLDGLIERHRRKYRLKPLLTALRPGE